MAERLSDAQWAEIQLKYGGVRLRRVPTAAGELVIRAPTAVEESTFQSMYFGSSMHAGMAYRNLLSMLCVDTPIHPDKGALKKSLDEWPGVAMNPRVIRELKLIRGEADEEEGK